MNSSSALIRVDPWASFWRSRLHGRYFSDENRLRRGFHDIPMKAVS
jgi:hypothetical protein